MDRPQFDEYLGGSVSLSYDAEINKLITARANEISAMSYSIDNPQQTKLIFQKLPIHMRRRVMSHNTKRIPRRLREAHMKQMEKSGLPPKVKRPSRKYRRRVQNLLLKYKNRKRNNAWLETHIWHAKRFHMSEKWGYKIANFSNNRGFRASYRAVSRHCMIQDISYYSCIELSGPENLLIEKLKNHCGEELSFGAKIYLKGSREGSLVFLKNNRRPIGTINFLWQPGEKEIKVIWIWLHPALFHDVFEELSSTFEFIESLQGSDNDKVIRNKVFISNNSECRMELLRNSFNRFRLRGPLSIAVMRDTLRLPNSSQQDSHESWEKVWYKDIMNKNCLNSQKILFEVLGTLNSPSQLPRHCVLAFTVIDPRFFLPETRRKPLLKHNNCINIDTLPASVSVSPLWDSKVRQNIIMNFKPTNDINTLRRCNLVPGVGNDIEFDENIGTKVPVILIQYPGTDNTEKSTGFSSGLDIILPSGWALPFWTAFAYRCAKPVGLREHRSMIFENLILNSPEVNHPDTPAYCREAEEIKKELVNNYFRRPPNKRINFTKFSISSPFYCEWSMLIKEWTDEDTVKVLRNRKALQSLKSILMNNSTDGKHRMKKRITPPINLELQMFNESLDQSLLIPVKVTILGKGRPKNFALICMPNDHDLETTAGPVQKIKIDASKNEKRLARLQRKVFLKRVMRQRLRMKREGKIVSKSFYQAKKKEYSMIMKNLCLPECKQVRNSCDREVMGYVVQGDFSFSEARGIGWGYIVVRSLLSLMELKTNIVLIRNVQSRQYRRARLDIINC